MVNYPGYSIPQFGWGLAFHKGQLSSSTGGGVPDTGTTFNSLPVTLSGQYITYAATPTWAVLFNGQATKLNSQLVGYSYVPTDAILFFNQPTKLTGQFVRKAA